MAGRITAATPPDSNNAEFFVPLKPFEEWPTGVSKERLIDELQKRFAGEFVGIGFNFSQYIQDNVEEGLSGVKGANSVKIIGRDLATLEAISQQVLKEMGSIEGVTDLGVFPVLGQPNLNIKVDRDNAARYGLNAGDINSVVQAALGGTTATTLFEADRQFGVTVRLTGEYRSNFDEIRNVKVSYQTPAGTNAYIPLSELADISLDTGASYIYHERNERFIPIKFSVRGRDLGSTVAAAQRRIAQNVKLPVGYRIVWAGEFEELQQAKARLEIIVPISLLMILALLYGLFNSLRDSLLALAGIPFAAGGGILALYFTGQDFSISAAVGFVSLFGVSVMNGILIMTYFHEVRTPGMSAVEAMFHAASQRMRPMLMTAAVRLHRFAAGRGLHGHWQSGAAPARHGRGRWNVLGPDHIARRRASGADAVSGSAAQYGRIPARRGADLVTAVNAGERGIKPRRTPRVDTTLRRSKR